MGWESYESINMVQKVTPVEFMDPEDIPEEMKEIMAPKENEPVTNIDFNAADKREHSEERYDSKSEKQIEEEVERELKEFEAKEFAKYKKEKVENVVVDKNKTTNDGIKTQETESDKTKTSSSFAGSVTAEWSLEQRDKEKLLKPSYVCKDGGKVKVNIVVDREGVVTEATIDKKGSSYKESCIGENALIYAKRCRFSVSTVAPELQNGWIIYTFISQ